MNVKQSLRPLLLLTILFTGFLLLGLALAPAAVSIPEAQISNAGWMEIGSGSATGGGITNSNNSSRQPTLVTYNDTAILSYTEQGADSGSEIYVKQWNGSEWVAFSNGSDSNGGISNTSGNSRKAAIALDPNGWPAVSWQDSSTGEFQIYVKRWNGSAWVQMGGSATGPGISNPAGPSINASLAITPDGIVVTWQDDEDEQSFKGYQIYVKRWNEGKREWEEMGQNSASGGIGLSNTWDDATSPVVAVGVDGNPMVAWAESNCDGYNVCSYDIFLKRWNGKEWLGLGGSATGEGISGTGQASRPFLAVDLDGSPIVAWEELYCNYGGVDINQCDLEIYLKKWDGKYWVELGNSATRGGISDNDTESRLPWLAIDPDDGSPVIAWSDGRDCEGPCEDEIYVRRWNGSQWVEMDAGSASGGGISQNITGFSVAPSLVFNARGIAMVAWTHRALESGDYDQIYARRYATCHPLSLNHTGQGEDPVTSPTSSPGCPPGTFIYGDKIVLTARPASDWRVVGWSGTDDNYSTAETNSLTMPDNSHIVTVNYAAGCYTLTLRHAGRGSDPVARPDGSPECSTGSYKAGQQITLTAKPADKWLVAGWDGTDNNASTAESNSLIMPASDHTVSVEYASTYGFIPLVRYGCFEGPKENEPNNNIGQANGPICEGRPKTISGLPDDEFDFIKIYTTHSGTITATVVDHYGKGTQLSLEHQPDKNKNVLFRVDNDSEAEDGLLVQGKDAEPGIYFVVIYTATPNPGETRPYVLEVDIQ